MSDTWTIRRLLDWTTDYLKSNGSDTARLDAEVLLANVRKCQRIMLYTAFDEVATDEARAAFRDLVRRRAEGEPVAYLVGYREFFSLDFKVDDSVLVPRPETEYIVTTLIDLAKERDSQLPAPRILDIGTGSGILAVCAAKHIESATLVATDICPLALDIAKANAERHGVADRIEFVESDVFSNLAADHAFDFIISNPPYIAIGDSAVEANVTKHEPNIALFAGEDGLDVIRRIVTDAAPRLNAAGYLIMEIGETQSEIVTDLIRVTGDFGDANLVKDQAGLPRIVVAQRTST